MATTLYREILARPRLSMISAEPDRELDGIAATIRPSLRIRCAAELEQTLDQLLAASDQAAASAPRTLDLIGHTAVSGHLQLGSWTIDAAHPVFRGLAERDVLPRLGIHALRLLGCHTAAPGPADATLARLAAILGIEVLGASQLLYGAHYDEHGFRDAWHFLLVPARAPDRLLAAPTALSPCALDLEALPVQVPIARAGDAPLRLATPGAAQQILALVRRDAGARMAVPMSPLCGLALTAGPDAYHIAHVLLDGAFLRFYPDGAGAPGVAYPVDDAARLWQIVDALPELPVSR